MDNEMNNDFYQGMRNKLAAWAKTKKGKENPFFKLALLAPDLFHLLVKLSIDKDVPVTAKAKLAIALAYFVSPIDLIPDFIPVVGYLDDIAVAAYVLNEILNKVDPEIVQKHWAGDGDAIDHVKKIIASADKMLGSGLLAKVLELLGVKGKLK
jgi:uncharacterized membrane protein YkvA (DUF1232 family)